MNLAEANGISDADEIIESVDAATARWPEITSEVGLPKSIISTIASNFIRL